MARAALLQERKFALQLGEEDRVAPGEAHGRPAPLAVFGNVVAVAVFRPGLNEHRIAIGRTAKPAVTADAIIGGQEMLRPVRTRRDVVQPLTGERDDIGGRDGDAIVAGEGLLERLVHRRDRSLLRGDRIALVVEVVVDQVLLRLPHRGALPGRQVERAGREVLQLSPAFIDAEDQRLTRIALHIGEGGKDQLLRRRAVATHAGAVSGGAGGWHVGRLEGVDGG